MSMWDLSFALAALRSDSHAWGTCEQCGHTRLLQKQEKETISSRSRQSLLSPSVLY